MSKIVIRELDSKSRSRRAQATKVPTRRVRRSDGKVETLYVLETLSPNLGDQLLKVFQLNVARARRRKVSAPKIAAE